MTDREIDSLRAGRGLDREVAEKVFGFKPCTFKVTGMYSAWATVWGCKHDDSSKCYPKNKEAVDHGHSPLLKYSEQIQNAWKVIDQYKHFAPVVFRAGGMMMLGEDKRPKGGEWGCRFDCAEDGKEDYLIGYGETPAEAIVKAALKVANRKEIK
jgi:hypothetical protein